LKKIKIVKKNPEKGVLYVRLPKEDLKVIQDVRAINNYATTSELMHDVIGQLREDLCQRMLPSKPVKKERKKRK
jgi:hypothetical protein